MTLLQALFSFKGRLNRAKYWLMQLLIIWAVLLFGLIAELLPDSMGDEGWLLFFLVILLPVCVFCVWSSLAVAVKRWHDRGKSGWWILIALIPIIGSIWTFIECGCLRGTDGPNRFGPDPLAKTQQVEP